MAAYGAILGHIVCLKHFVGRYRRQSRGSNLNLLGGADAEVSVVHSVRHVIGEPLAGCPEGEAIPLWEAMLAIDGTNSESECVGQGVLFFISLFIKQRVTDLLHQHSMRF